VLVLSGGVALALHISPSAEAVPDPSATPQASDTSASPSPSTSVLLDSAGSPIPTTRESPSAPLPPGRNVLVLGDSLGLDVYAWLADLLPDRYVSYAAVVGRDTPTTLVALRQLDAQGDVPPVVLVSLGTNDVDAGSFRQAAESILTTLGPNRCVVWSDVVRPASIGGGAQAINDVIDDLGRTHSNLRIFHWSALVAQHPDWLSGDGIHPGDDGAQARAQAFADAALACSPLDASAPKASQEYLPPSAFVGPGGVSVQTGPTPLKSPRSSTPHPTSSVSRTSSPSHSSSPTSSAAKSTSPSPPTSTAPVSAQPPPVSPSAPSAPPPSSASPPSASP
jgi:hypothetical protein